MELLSYLLYMWDLRLADTYGGLLNGVDAKDL